MITSPVHALPKHEPCGVSYGRIVGAGLSLVCEERREFARCARCKPPAEAPTRGDPRCPSCKGVGYLVTRTHPGCGVRASMCACGCTSRLDDGPCERCMPQAFAEAERTRLAARPAAP